MLPAILIGALALIKEIHFIIAYISNTNSFPLPLTEEEEKKYLIAYSQGTKGQNQTGRTQSSLSGPYSKKIQWYWQGFRRFDFYWYNRLDKRYNHL